MLNKLDENGKTEIQKFFLHMLFIGDIVFGAVICFVLALCVLGFLIVGKWLIALILFIIGVIIGIITPTIAWYITYKLKTDFNCIIFKGLT